MDKRNWFFRQRVTFAEMREADDLAEKADRNLVKDAFVEDGTGFLMAKVDVKQDPGGPSEKVEVKAGLGWDGTGRRVERTATQAATLVDLAGDGGVNGRRIRLYLVFTRAESDPRTDGNGATVQYDQDESSEIQKDLGPDDGSFTPPTLRTDGSIFLATITKLPAGTIPDANIDTAFQVFKSSFPVSRLKDFPSIPASPDGYFGEIKIVRDSDLTPTGFKIEAEFVRVFDTTNGTLLALVNETIDGAATAAVGVSGMAPTETKLDGSTASTFGKMYYIYVLGDTTPTANAPIAMISEFPGPFFGATPSLPPGYDVFRRIGAVPTFPSGAPVDIPKGKGPGKLIPLRKIGLVTLYENYINTQIATSPGALGTISTALYVPVTAERCILRGEYTTIGVGGGGQAFLTFRNGAANPVDGQAAQMTVFHIPNTSMADAENTILLEVGPPPSLDVDVFLAGASVIAGVNIAVRGFVDDMRHV